MTSSAQPRSGLRTTAYHSIVMWRRIVFLGSLPAIVAMGAAIWIGRDTLAQLGAGDLVALAVIILALVTLGLGIFVLSVVVPTVSRPAEQLADVAEAAAEGDLSRSPGIIGKGGIHRLSSAVDRMLGELRTVVRALRDSSSETAALAAEITTGAEHMASAAQEMAATSNELSRQSTEMADTIQGMAKDAQRLVSISEELSGGAHEGVQRNSRLRVLAAENRQRLDESAGALETLAAEVEGSAAAVEALAQASEEIRAFVTFVQKMARQSKLLALNAAMEAARAGEQGQGFAVVASEVRRLAAGASEAAERTEALVQGVLAGVADSRASSGRAVEVVTAVTAATRQAQQSFALVEEGVNEVETWTAAIDRAATTSRALVIDTTRGLDELAKGTEAFAAAMEQVAASSQEQSASTEQIAAAASALNAASGRLAQIVTTFRLGEGESKPAIAAGPSAPITFQAKTSGAMPVGTLRLA